MTRESVKGEKANVDEHDHDAEADAEFAAEAESFENVIPKKAEEEDGEIEKIAMNVLQDEGKRSFATIVFAEAGFAHSTGGRVEKESAIVSLPVVITGQPEATRCPENKKRRRK